MKVLVTGGAGFIGSHTVDLLLERGYRVRVLDLLQERVHPRGRPDWVSSDVEFIRGDVSDRDDLARSLRGMEAVLHLAAHQDHQPEYSRFIHTNTESTALIFELIAADPRSFPVRKIVVASSQAVSGEGKYRCPDDNLVFWPDPRPLAQLQAADWDHHCPRCGAAAEPLPMDEATCNKANTAYGISKLALERLVFALGLRHGIAAVAMRYTHVQGSRNSIHNAYSGAARRFALQLAAGQSPSCYEDGRQLCDFVNVVDVARANLLALEEPGADGQALFVGGSRPVSVFEFANLMCAAYGREIEPVVPGRFRYGDPRHMISDGSRMAALGWRATITVEESIRQYLDWLDGQEPDYRTLEEAERNMVAAGVLNDVR